ncbi:cellulase family glycosylhydrolase [Gynurincola endophyticus]|uniref:cellulase family glycosylhydrolase n=1 Tax=Gynurincola endophyticus TaxID=2479004 RepID=UPI000F8CE363|nr:cellulase family glycosylhydrolase [Gynurincola endophyticus]
MKNIIRKGLLLVGISLLGMLETSAQGFLRADGKKIVTGTGEEIILRGMGLGGWMLQEGYMYHLSFLGQQYRIREKIAASVGEEKAAQFYKEWLLKHTTKKDIDALAALGFNSIRLPMHYALYTLPVEKEPVDGQQTWLEEGFALTDSLLNWCKQNKIYLILDLHAAPGGQGNDLAISDRDPNKPSLWDSEANLQKTIALWKQLAKRYANEPWIGAYDIINEPNWGFDDPKDIRGTEEKRNIPLRKLMVDITAAIREVDQNHLIFIEGNGFGNNYRGIFPLWDNNTAVSFHKYGNFNDQQTIKYFLDLRDQYNVPLWLGESGENFNTWFTEAIELMEKNNIGWAWWQHKKMGLNNSYEIKQPEGYSRLLADWSGRGEKLNEKEAWAILQEFLHNVELAQNVFHKDVADAMFRQVHSLEAIPFKEHTIKTGILSINAVDYDLGRQRVAYYDKDSSRYQYTPGVNTDGNKGRRYRNDGVDIYADGNNFYVGSVEDEEWLLYTLTVKKTGNYSFSFTTRSDTAGRITLMGNEKILVDEIVIPETATWTDVKTNKVKLRKGIVRLKVLVKKGGFDLSAIKVSKD